MRVRNTFLVWESYEDAPPRRCVSAPPFDRAMLAPSPASPSAAPLAQADVGGGSVGPGQDDGNIAVIQRAWEVSAQPAPPSPPSEARSSQRGDSVTPAADESTPPAQERCESLSQRWEQTPQPGTPSTPETCCSTLAIESAPTPSPVEENRSQGTATPEFRRSTTQGTDSDRATPDMRSSWYDATWGDGWGEEDWSWTAVPPPRPAALRKKRADTWSAPSGRWATAQKKGARGNKTRTQPDPWSEDPRATTIAIKNLNKQQDVYTLIAFLDEQGMGEEVDYVYVPLGLSGRPKDEDRVYESCGFAFINCTTATAARRAVKLLGQAPLARPERELSVLPARVQGTDENVTEFYRRASERGGDACYNHIALPWRRGGGVWQPIPAPKV